MKKHVSYDQTKKMLNTLRKLNEQQSHSKPLTEGIEIPDELKNDQKFDIDTESNDQEQQQTSTPSIEATDNVENNITVINNVEVKLNSTDSMDMKLQDEQKSAISGIIDTFRQQVSQTANLDPGFTINPNQIRFDGEISEVDMHFTYVVGEDQGLYTTSEMSQVTPEYIQTLTKMSKFDQMFRDAMEPLITQRQNN